MDSYDFKHLFRM